jgi:hypothetical protein
MPPCKGTNNITDANETSNDAESPHNSLVRAVSTINDVFGGLTPLTRVPGLCMKAGLWCIMGFGCNANIHSTGGTPVQYLIGAYIHIMFEGGEHAY